MRSKEQNMAIIISVLLVLFVGIILIEIASITYKNKNTKYDPLNTSNITTKKDEKITLDISDMKFENLKLTGKHYIKCTNGCNHSVDDYYFLVNLINNKYFLSILYKDDVLIYNKDIGNNINAYLTRYKDGIIFYNLIDDGIFKYDYAIYTLNDKTDEFASQDDNELALTEEGIKYFITECKNSEIGIKQEILRLPLSENINIVGSKEVTASWCS